MPNFNFPSLLGPGYLTLWLAIGLPILIHLINMLRHRRVEWAAMEFLLLSHKKNRTWVRLKQLLLLLMRMAALALVAFLVAQPLLSNRIGALFGSSSTHHIVLLDDSFSMSDHWADTTAFDQAKQAIERLAKAAAERAEEQRFTIVRFSQVGRAQPDVEQALVNRQDFLKDLADTLQKTSVSQQSVGALGALKAAEELIDASKGERRVVYLFSDFRKRDWNDPGDLQKELQDMTKQETELRLINCSDRARPNLAITQLAPAEGILAANVQFNMEVTVKNFGTTAVAEVPVSLTDDGRPRAAVTIQNIAPGQSVTKSFPAVFESPGQHQITASLPSDAVAIDNTRYAVLDLPRDVPILLADGDPKLADAFWVGSASAPGGAVRTGLRTPTDTLRNLGIKSLDEYQAINLFNFDSLDEAAITALEKFVEAGGGLAFFVGDRTQPKFVNEKLFKEGKGLFPAPLRGAAELMIDRLERAPDVVPGDHSIFRVFGDARNPLTASMSVRRYMAVPEGWAPEKDSTVEVIARLRNGAPLAITQSFGKGRVVAFLTSGGPSWNNWARNPSFVVMMQDMQAYLARRAAIEVSRTVGSPLTLRLAKETYQPGVKFRTPSNFEVSFNASTQDDNKVLVAQFDNTFTAGIYQAVLSKVANEPDTPDETRLYAYNVDAAEGDLNVISQKELATRLEGVKYLFEPFDMFQYNTAEMAGYNLGQAMLILLILLLLGEQFVAWSAGYHPPARAAKGGAR